MSGKFHILDCNEHSIALAGVPIEGGFAEDTFLEIEYLSPAFVTVVGADGDVTRSKTNDRRAKIRLTLMQTSPENAKLSAMHNLDLKASNGAGVGPCLIKDNQGLSVYAGEKSWIAAPPNPVQAKTGQARVWEFECAHLEGFEGGN